VFALGVTIAMVAMTAATAVWWVALADSAPWFLAGGTAGAGGSRWRPNSWPRRR
jgi:hypothetical protein